jgi:GT2 family glycosyltransferase
MHATVRASIVVVTFNHRQVIPACLDALGRTVGADDEVIVIDNASSDGTADLIAAQYPKVTLVRSDTNDGFGAACNRGATLARGKYLVFLNPDTQPQTRWVDPLVEALDTVPNAGMTTAKILLARSPEHIDAFGNEVHISGLTTCRGWGKPAQSFTDMEEVSAVSGACFAIRKDLFNVMGGFDKLHFLYFEDTDLSLRVRFAGYRCIAVPQARVLHDHHPGFPPAKLRYLERNRWWTLLKLLDVRTMIALAPALIMAEVLAWALALTSGPRHVTAKGRAWLDLIARLPTLPRARVAARLTHTTTDRDVLRLHPARLHCSQVSTTRERRYAERVTEVLFTVPRLVAMGSPQVFRRQAHRFLAQPRP